LLATYRDQISSRFKTTKVFWRHSKYFPIVWSKAELRQSFSSCVFLSSNPLFWSLCFSSSGLSAKLVDRNSYSYPPSPPSHCIATTSCSCVFKVITLAWVNQGNYYQNANACSKRTLKTIVAKQLKFFILRCSTKKNLTGYWVLGWDTLATFLIND